MVVNSPNINGNNNNNNKNSENITSIHSLSNDASLSMMDSARVGLDYIVENADYVQKLASGI